MSLFLYNLFLKLYQAGIRLSAKQGSKAQKWLAGRKSIFSQIETALDAKDEKRIWIHCASLGEFEQGRPIIEAVQKSEIRNQKSKIVLTFFSPSGYEIRKDDAEADYVFYLPMDGKENAERFVSLINPSLAIFVKYEFWYYYLYTLSKRNIPTYLISATFRTSQPFFKWYGGLFRKMLGFYSYLFLQDEKSKMLLSGIGIGNATVAGDTRYDRVARIAAEAKEIPVIEEWKKESKILIAGSTWQDDEKLLAKAVTLLPEDWKLIIAPHEIHEKHLCEIEQQISERIVRYSSLTHKPDAGKVLLIDNIGMLSGLYRYGDMAFVGGGFTQGGIHNILEPAVFGLPIVFGPNYKKFTEAVQMVEKQLAFSIKDAGEYTRLVDKLINDTAYRAALQDEIARFMQSRQGATEVIVRKVLSAL